MKEKYIEEIRKACIKANPSILDLKFGCEVKIEEDKYLVISKQLDEKVFCLYENESYTRFFGEDQFEILGRKINLQDVLLAIPTVVHFSNCFIDSKNTVSGQIDTGREVIDYDLKLPLEEQSEEVLLKISELIK